jgi:protein transport protein SEC31
MIIGGCENGSINLYDFDKILSKDYNSAVKKLDKHTGTVGALDINPLQPNLLASGAGASEILIWDLNNPATPTMPGAKLLVR